VSIPAQFLLASTTGTLLNLGVRQAVNRVREGRWGWIENTNDPRWPSRSPLPRQDLRGTDEQGEHQDDRALDGGHARPPEGLADYERPSADRGDNHLASYNATAPIEASSGPRKRHRLNPRGNRQLNHAMHIIAFSQLSHAGPGRDYYERKIAEGKTQKEAVRALKRQISDVAYRQLVRDAQR